VKSKFEQIGQKWVKSYKKSPIFTQNTNLLTKTAQNEFIEIRVNLICDFERKQSKIDKKELKSRQNAPKKRIFDVK